MCRNASSNLIRVIFNLNTSKHEHESHLLLQIYGRISHIDQSYTHLKLNENILTVRVSSWCVF